MVENLTNDPALYQAFSNGGNQQVERALFICSVSPQKVKKCLKQLQGIDISLLIPKSQKGMWPNYSTISYENSVGKESETFDITDTLSKLIQNLKAQNFDLVVIPYDDIVNWGDVKLERFVEPFTNRFMIVFPNGKTRLYTEYDALNRIIYNKAYLGNMFRFVPRPKGKKILDVGCSDGLVCDLLLNEDPESVVGIDILEGVGCNYKDPRITYAKMDALNLLFKDNTFDLCFSIATLEHCSDPFVVLQEMKRVTKKGGYCYVQAGPLYYSPFGHHMFGYFDDYPWIHLRLSRDEIIDYCKNHQIDSKIKQKLGRDVGEYIDGMINVDHINGKSLQEYRLDEFMKSPEIEVLNFSRSYEGKNLLNKHIIVQELKHIPQEDLVVHGFELVFKVL